MVRCLFLVSAVLICLISPVAEAQMSQDEARGKILKLLDAKKYQQALTLAELTGLRNDPQLKAALAPAEAEKIEADKKKAAEAERKAKEARAESQKLLASMEKKEDKIERITWYKAKGVGGVANKLYLYFGIKEGRPTALRVVMMYAGEDWIFANEYVIASAGGTQIRGRADFERDSTYGKVWEVADLALTDDATTEKLAYILRDGEVTLRLQGKYRRDIKLSKVQTKAALDTIKAYKSLQN